MIWCVQLISSLSWVLQEGLEVLAGRNRWEGQGEGRLNAGCARKWWWLGWSPAAVT